MTIPLGSLPCKERLRGAAKASRRKGLEGSSQFVMEGSKEEPGLSVVVTEGISGNEPKLRPKKIHLNMRKTDYSF